MTNLIEIKPGDAFGHTFFHLFTAETQKPRLILEAAQKELFTECFWVRLFAFMSSVDRASYPARRYKCKFLGFKAHRTADL